MRVEGSTNYLLSTLGNFRLTFGAILGYIGLHYPKKLKVIYSTARLAQWLLKGSAWRSARVEGLGFDIGA